MLLPDAISDTLAFFSLSNYPLTAFEIHKWLYRKDQIKATNVSERISLAEVYEALRQMSGFVEEKDGFFFLPGHSRDVAQRLRIYFDNQKKVKRGQLAARLISFFPFWRLAAITNTVAQENSRPTSDIDWLVVVKEGRLWTARFLLTLWLSLFGLRRHGKKVANRICLSFFITENNLNLAPLALNDGDIYLTYWPTKIIPLLNAQETLEKFFRANFWVREYLPNFNLDYLSPDHRALSPSPAARFFKQSLEKLLSGRAGDAAERFLRHLQLTKMSKREEARIKEIESAVVINDQMLKFHEIDRRLEIHTRWQKLVSN